MSQRPTEVPPGGELAPGGAPAPFHPVVPCAPRKVPALSPAALVRLLASLATVDNRGTPHFCASREYVTAVVRAIAGDHRKTPGQRAAAGRVLQTLRDGSSGGEREWVALVECLQDNREEEPSGGPAGYPRARGTVGTGGFGGAAGHAVLPVVLYLPHLRSPFNCGNIVRSAAAFGAAAVVLGPDAPDQTHPRFLRSAMGSEQLIPVIRGDLDTCRNIRGIFTGDSAGDHCTAGVAELPLCALEQGGEPLHRLNAAAPRIFVLGHEQYGVPHTLREMCRSRGGVWTIPHEGPKGSLNVGVAAGILLNHLAHVHRG